MINKRVQCNDCGFVLEGYESACPYCGGTSLDTKRIPGVGVGKQVSGTDSVERALATEHAPRYVGLDDDFAQQLYELADTLRQIRLREAKESR